MICRYCIHFQHAKWRINPDGDDLPDGKKKKDVPQLRHCHHVNKYIKDTREKCEVFEPNKTFWCQINDNWMNVDACIHRRNSGLDDDCQNCKQYLIIIDLKRGLTFLKRKREMEEKEENEKSAKPTLLRRIKQEP